jgi:hypothetical protein
MACDGFGHLGVHGCDIFAAQAARRKLTAPESKPIGNVASPFPGVTAANYAGSFCCVDSIYFRMEEV